MEFIRYSRLTEVSLFLNLEVSTGVLEHAVQPAVTVVSVHKDCGSTFVGRDEHEPAI